MGVWTRQPPAGTPIAQDNPFDICAAYLPTGSNTFIESVLGRSVLEPGSGMLAAAGPPGKAVKGEANTTDYMQSTDAYANSHESKYHWGFMAPKEAVSLLLFFQSFDSPATGIFAGVRGEGYDSYTFQISGLGNPEFEFRVVDTRRAPVHTDDGDFVNGDPVVGIGRWQKDDNSGYAECHIFHNGQLRASADSNPNAMTGDMTYNTADTSFFNVHGRSGQAGRSITNYHLILVSTRKWTDGEMKSLAENPWQVFEPEPEYAFLDVPTDSEMHDAGEVAPRLFRESYQFDDVTGQQLVYPNRVLEASKDAFSIAAWIRARTFPGSNGGIACHTEVGDASTGWWWSVRSGGGVQFTLQDTDTEWTPGLSANTWYHLAVTWDGTTARLYIDGAQNNTATPAVAVETPNEDIYVGVERNFYTTTGEFDGQIAQFLYYPNETLTADEIKLLYLGKRIRIPGLDASVDSAEQPIREISTRSGNVPPVLVEQATETPIAIPKAKAEVMEVEVPE